MNIGARIAAWAGSRWKNPYPVPETLAAMYDAEWNAGGGVHVASTMGWKDVCGNEPDLAPLDGVTSLDFSDKALTTTSTIPWNSTTGRLFNQYATAWTVEAGFKNQRMGYGFPSFYNGRENSTRGCQFLVPIWGSNPTYSNKNISAAVYNVITGLNSTISTGDDIALAMTFSNGEAKAYVNGAFDSICSVGGSNPNSLLGVGGNISSNNTTSGACYQRYYFFRISRRALTADEIAARYAIDRARFNLT